MSAIVYAFPTPSPSPAEKHGSAHVIPLRPRIHPLPATPTLPVSLTAYECRALCRAAELVEGLLEFRDPSSEPSALLSGIAALECALREEGEPVA